MEKLNKVLTVDPGWNTGLALWVGDNYPMISIIIEPPRRKKIKVEPLRIKYMFDMFKAYVLAREIDTMIIEGVELWSGSVRSVTSATRGDTFTLAYIVGGYMNICFHYGIEVKIVYPRGNKKQNKETWKGGLNASMLEKRIFRINGETYAEHVREAVGIGFHKMGLL